MEINGRRIQTIAEETGFIRDIFVKMKPLKKETDLRSVLVSGISVRI